MLRVELHQTRRTFMGSPIYSARVWVLNCELLGLPGDMRFDARVPAGSAGDRFETVGSVAAAIALALAETEHQVATNSFLSQGKLGRFNKMMKRHRGRSADALIQLRTLAAALNRGACKAQYGESHEVYVIDEDGEDEELEAPAAEKGGG